MIAMKLHENAIEAAITAAEPSLTPADQPLLELARTLARQVDEAGLEGPGTRLAGTYLTAVRTLMARLASVPPAQRTGKLHELRSAIERQRSA
jgi:hypothetical protein